MIPLSTDGNALKPSIEFDSRLKTCAGLDIPVDIAFIKKNPKITPEFLQNHIVTEVLISSVTTLDNVMFHMFCGICSWKNW